MLISLFCHKGRATMVSAWMRFRLIGGRNSWIDKRTWGTEVQR